MSPVKRVPRTPKLDAVGAEAVEAARAGLLDLVAVQDVGEHLGVLPEEGKVVTHLFECRRAGYRGWRWSVTVSRAPRQKTVTIDEVVLLPGDDALVAPPWLPWRERVQPGDLGPGDLLPTEENDLRLVPGYADPEQGTDPDEVRTVADELGLGRERVLSVEGREEAAERWYEGQAGPEAPIAQAAPAPCATCGFLVRIAGPLGRVFGVCANGFANDDGRVVSYDHGCGAHSEVALAHRDQPQPLPDPVWDTLLAEDLERF